MQRRTQEFQIPQLHTLSSLARPIDFKTPSNRIAVGVAGLGFVLAAALHAADGGDVAAAVIEGLFAAMTVFVAWVIAREIDPDHQGASLVTLGVALLVYFVVGIAALFSVAAVVLTARFMNRSVGPVPKWTDAAALVTVVGLAVVIHGHWFLGIIVFLTLLFENLLPKSDPNAFFYAIAVAAVTLVGTFLAPSFFTDWSFDAPAFGLALILAGTYGVFMLRQPHFCLSMCDDGSQRLEWWRVAAAQIFVLMASIVVAMSNGADGIGAMGSAWAAMGGVGLYAIYRIATKQPIPEPPDKNTRPYRIVES